MNRHSESDGKSAEKKYNFSEFVVSSRIIYLSLVIKYTYLYADKTEHALILKTKTKVSAESVKCTYVISYSMYIANCNLFISLSLSVTLKSFGVKIFLQCSL